MAQRSKLWEPTACDAKVSIAELRALIDGVTEVLIMTFEIPIEATNELYLKCPAKYKLKNCWN